MIRIAILTVFILITGCARNGRDIRPELPVKKEFSKQEIISILQQRHAGLPDFTALIKVTLTHKIKKSFFAKWKRQRRVNHIEGFDPFGGTLFDFREVRSATSTYSKITLRSDQLEEDFKGDRAAFQRYILKKVPESMRTPISWMILFDWIAAGGLPDFSLPYYTVMDPQQKTIVLNRSSDANTIPFLAEKIFLDKKTLTVREVRLFDSNNVMGAQMIFRDYRSISHHSGSSQILFPFLTTIKGPHFKGEIAISEIKEI